MKIIKVKTIEELGVTVGNLFIAKIKSKPNAVLGLATGSSPLSTYKYIVNDYKTNNTDWSKVVTFNLDEYKGLDGTHKKSYKYFMNNELFDYINIDKNNTHIPDGKNTDNPAKYDEKIASYGGIDLQLLGIGINGHVGFNEPGTSFESLTSIVDLTQSTIDANARFFASKGEVPKQAISMGLKSIMNAKEIILIASGENKQDAIFHLVEGKVSDQWPCSILQNHPNVTVVIDEAASKKLTTV
ncbi:glucosamine-6-phosphate deaminase [Spiroplasma endosymbiont of Labia minor]|uniref:glucosamine-6-phosphate deaminase n=1 Tax=Spiroplasma endosymbiont of Labia minor TaxID=3066305 RepID=UPI0030CBA3BA